MKTYLTALALAAALAQPAAAIPFSKLTTIYVGSGVYDDGGGSDAGVATSIHCSNVSGVSVQVRVLILGEIGGVEGSLTRTLAHGATQTFSTHRTLIFTESVSTLETGAVRQGVVNVEATNSAVFCTGHIVDAAGNPPAFMGDLHLVRVNPHPGTVE
jgi:hypothetical protein